MAARCNTGVTSAYTGAHLILEWLHAYITRPYVRLHDFGVVFPTLWQSSLCLSAIPKCITHAALSAVVCWHAVPFEAFLRHMNASGAADYHTPHTVRRTPMVSPEKVALPQSWTNYIWETVDFRQRARIRGHSNYEAPRLWVAWDSSCRHLSCVKP